MRLLAGCLRHISMDACESRQTRPAGGRQACTLHSHVMNRERPDSCCTDPLCAGGLPSKPPKIRAHDTAETFTPAEAFGGLSLPRRVEAESEESQNPRCKAWMKRRAKPNLDPSARVRRHLRLRAKIYAANPPASSSA